MMLCMILTCIIGSVISVANIFNLVTGRVQVTYDCRKMVVTPEVPQKVIDECKKEIK